VNGLSLKLKRTISRSGRGLIIRIPQRCSKRY